ncbi:MAG TPA: hypothetical protein VNK70_00560 [Candidatus Paceibacterota bacterium]|nr:hypothetical protein [Candidatus Paceibacterota bacterium]
MKNTIFVALFLMIFAGVAAAQTSSVTDRKDCVEIFDPVKQENRIVCSGKDTPFSGRVQGVPTSFPENVRQLKATSSDQIKILKEEMKIKMENSREEFKSSFEAKREEAKKQIENERKELKKKLEKMKDENRKKIVERLSEKLNELNSRLTTHYLSVLDKLEKILDNIVSRTDKAEARGLDVGAVRTAVTSAETAIAEAKAAIDVQVGKIYSFDLATSTVTASTATSTEHSLKSIVGEARQTLHADLAAVKEKVKAAHEAVRRAAVALAQVPRVNEDATSTPSTPTSTTTSSATSTE